MSALDDALARARVAPAPQHEPNLGELRQEAKVVLDALITETAAKLRALEIPLLDAWRLQQSEYTFYAPELVARAWPMQAFMLTEDGKPYPYTELRRGPSTYDRSGRDHIYVGEMLFPEVIASATNSVVAFRSSSPTKLLYRPTFESTVTDNPTLRDRFPHGEQKAYPLEDFLAHAILELAAGNY